MKNCIITGGSSDCKRNGQQQGGLADCRRGFICGMFQQGKKQQSRSEKADQSGSIWRRRHDMEMSEMRPRV